MTPIGFAGKAGAGKTTTARLVASWLNYEFGLDASTNSFAKPIRKAVSEIYGLSMVFLTRGKDEPTHLLWEKFPYRSPRRKGLDLKGLMTHREVMQEFGTFVRDADPDAWVRSAMRDDLYSDGEVVVFDDVRYPDEFRAIAGRGGHVFYLTRTPDEPARSSDHDSEYLLSPGFEHPGVWTDLDNNKTDLAATAEAALMVLHDKGLSRRPEEARA